MVLANEALTTVIADERFLSGMKTPVPSEVGFVIELLRAHFTFVGFVTAVLSEMVRKGWGCRESFATSCTFKGLSP
jgi:hypothetical protein